MRALKSRLGRRHKADGSLNLTFSSLLLQLSQLETINRLHMGHLSWLRATTTCSSVRLPTLFAEIFDIPVSSKSSTSSGESATFLAGLRSDEDEEDEEAEAAEEEAARGASDERLPPAQTLWPEVASATSGEATTTSSSTNDDDEQTDLFFVLAANFPDDSDGRHCPDAADLNPTVDCLGEL